MSSDIPSGPHRSRSLVDIDTEWPVRNARQVSTKISRNSIRRRKSKIASRCINERGVRSCIVMVRDLIIRGRIHHRNAGGSSLDQAILNPCDLVGAASRKPNIDANAASRCCRSAACERRQYLRFQ